MTNETSLAFDTVEARSRATAQDAPLDRISVRDFTTSVEIGAFQSERDVEQRIRFNVVLEVARHGAADTDDVDQVLSYDTITEAITAELAAERLNLLETLAERIAERILCNAKAERVFVRIEKLDRIPGSLGVEIVRRKSGHPSGPGPDLENLKPLVVLLPNEILALARGADWIDAVADHARPAILCLEPVQTGFAATGRKSVDQRLRLLAIEQNAWMLAGRDPRCVVVSSRTELDWAVKNGQLSVWAPSKMVLDAVDSGLTADSDAEDLARWIARELGADGLSVAGSGALTTPDAS